MIMMDPMKFCSPERAYPIWKTMILPSSGYFWSKLCLQVLCNSQISFHHSDSDSELHKGSMSLAASDVNSPFSILLSLCFSGSCRFTGCDRRCMNNHLFMVCLTLTHGSVWSAHTWNEAEWMGFLHPLEKVKFKIMLWSSRPSGETFSTCKMRYIVENNLYLKNKYLKQSGLFHSASPLFTSQNRTQLLLHAAEKAWSSPLTRHWETLSIYTQGIFLLLGCAMQKAWKMFSEESLCSG